MSSYTVAEDDTLWKIGVAHGLNPDTATNEMFAANPGLNGSDELQIGQVINIPGGRDQNDSDQDSALNIQNQGRKVTLRQYHQTESAKADNFCCKARREASQRGHGRGDLVWDNGLANAASQWANEMARTGQFKHSGVSGQGENLYGTTGSPSFAAASQTWVNEVGNYHGQSIGQGDFPKYGHYTQVSRPHSTGIQYPKTCDFEENALIHEPKADCTEYKCVWPSAARVGLASAKSGNGWTYTVGRYDSQQLSGGVVW
jgi:uncharacterized protein YkwD